MPTCRNCGTDLGESDNFCSNCATPQNDEASRRLDGYVRDRATRMSHGGSDGGGLRSRLRYALGYLGVVAGLATLTAGPGLFFLLAGLFVLPATGELLESRLGRPLGDRPTAAAATALVVVGAAAFVVV